MPVIFVMNASSRADTGITDDLARSVAWVNASQLPLVECVTLSDGPNGISTTADSDRAATAVLRFVGDAKDREDVVGFIVACFSDPGVHAARDMTSKPVIGIGEAGFMAALGLGDRVGTIGVSAGYNGKNIRAARVFGVSDRVAGHEGLGLDYSQLKDPRVVTESLVSAGRRLRDEKGAQAILFAGAGLARYVEPLQQAIGLPVVDPTQSAVGLLLAHYMQAAYASAAPKKS